MLGKNAGELPPTVRLQLRKEFPLMIGMRKLQFIPYHQWDRLLLLLFYKRKE